MTEAKIKISIDGSGRYLDKIFPIGDCSNHLPTTIEWLWRSLKQKAVYLHEITDGFQAKWIIDY